MSPTHQCSKGNEMTYSTSVAAVEARARRAARAVGYVARKSRRRLSMENHGGFMIVDPDTNFAVAGFTYDMSAEEVIEWCAGCR